MTMTIIPLLLALAAPSQAAAPPTAAARATPAPVTVEYYYRIRWGSKDEFLRLYRLNHEPVLREMQKAGWITTMTAVEPFMHMAGDQRWDLRVTLTYRDGEAAVGDGSGYETASAAVTRRLYPDRVKHGADEARRMALLEEHWDLLVKPVAAQ